jgi:hypothetical protein
VQKLTNLEKQSSWFEIICHFYEVTADTFSWQLYPAYLSAIKDSSVKVVITDSINKKVIYFSEDYTRRADVVYYDSLGRIKEIRRYIEGYSVHSSLAGGLKFSYRGNSPFVARETFYDSDEKTRGGNKYRYKFYQTAAGKKAKENFKKGTNSN